MRYEQDLRVSLRDRFRRLMVARYADAATEVGFATDWIGRQPALRAILAEAQRVEPDLDFELFRKDFRWGDEIPWYCRTEEGRATLVWLLMQHIAERARRAIVGDVISEYVLAMSRGLNDGWREFTERVLQPLFDYLDERVGSDSSVLYVLERYVRRVEWFDRQELHTRAMADTRKAEEVYDADLRRFLFSEGTNMPFSQAKSASGLSDVVSELDTDDALVCELKVFDGRSRGKSHLGAGVNQAIAYATDYGKHTAYLVVINLSGRQLALPSDGDAKIWPAYLDVAGVRVHLVSVRALPPDASASKQGKPAPIHIARADLVEVDPDTTDSPEG